MKKNNKRLTITVGIPVHNEEANIENLLMSIFIQRGRSFSIEKVVVVCDGCTDNTPTIVENLQKKFPQLVLLNDRNKLGKKERLKQIYKLNTSDIVMTFDGDIILRGKGVMKQVITQFIAKKADVVSCNAQPFKAENLTNFFTVSTNIIWSAITATVQDGNNVFNIKGCGLAMRRAFAKKIPFHSSVLSDAQYIYFFARKKKCTFIFASNAIIYYRAPMTLEDYFLQSRRAGGSSDVVALSRIFGKSVFHEYKILTIHKLFVLTMLLFTDPLVMICGVLFKVVADVIPYNHTNSQNKKFWKPVQSTKKGIPISKLSI